MRMLNRNPKRLFAEVFSSAQKQPKQNASSQNREENGSTTLRNTREKPLLAGYFSLSFTLKFAYMIFIFQICVQNFTEDFNRKCVDAARKWQTN